MAATTAFMRAAWEGRVEDMAAALADVGDVNVQGEHPGMPPPAQRCTLPLGAAS